MGILLNIEIISSFRWLASRLRVYSRSVSIVGLGISIACVKYVKTVINKRLIAHVGMGKMFNKYNNLDNMKLLSYNIISLHL